MCMKLKLTSETSLLAMFYYPTTLATSHGNVITTGALMTVVATALILCLYIEHPLQATYTTAMFFLFQDAVVRDVVPISATSTPTTSTLNFDGSIQHVDVWISIPYKSALITSTSCGVLIVALLLVVMWPLIRGQDKSSDPLGKITTPHVVARVMLDAVTFPPYALHRRVVDYVQVKEDDNGHNAEALVIHIFDTPTQR